MLVAAGWGIFAILDALEDHPRRLAVDVATAIATLGLRVWALRGGELRLRAAGEITLGVSACSLIGAGLLSGQTASPAAWFFCCLPLFAGYLNGVRSAIVWSGIGGLLALLLGFTEGRFAAPTEFVPDASDRTMAQIVLVALVLGFTVTARRITDKQLEELRVREKRITEQATELAEQAAELARARDVAVAASRVKSEFLATMSHEIRTPLNAIVGMSALLDVSKLDADAQDGINTIRLSAEQLKSLVSDVLDYSKIEAGEIKLEERRFELRSLLVDTLGVVVWQAQSKNLELKGSLAAGVPEILIGDKTRVRQILLNLLSNAIKFTAMGSVTLTAEAPEVGDESALLHLTVRDTGMGIAEELRPLLFRPFQQADSSDAKRFGGTGLGLAISLRLAQAMGGTITVTSVLEHGSTFRVSLELGSPKGGSRTVDTTPLFARKPPADESILKRHSDFAALHPRRILLVEDNVINQKVAVRILERLGYAPDVVDTAREAIEAVKTVDYDVILMDLQMPDMGGIEATHAIRDVLAARSQPRIIAMTASATSTQRDACERAGMSGFLGKPVDIGDLMQALLGTTSGPPSASSDDADLVRLADAGALGAVRELFDDDGFRSLLSDHLSQCEIWMNAIRGASAAGNREVLARSLHSLRGSVGQFGGTQVREFTASFERDAATADLDELRARLPALEELVRAHCEALLRAMPAVESRAGGFSAA
ncbi:MAG: ATP-binding protein [Polyangiaceae bacterium]